MHNLENIHTEYYKNRTSCMLVCHSVTQESVPSLLLPSVVSRTVELQVDGPQGC